MKKTPDPAETVRDKVVPAAEDLVAALAERVAPLAHQVSDAVAPLAQQVSDAVSPLAHQVSDAVSPYAHQAAEAVSPYAAQVGDLGHQAAEKVAPYAHQAAEAVAPYAALVRQQGVKSGHELADRLEPALEAAKDAFSGARDKVTGEYVPAVGAAAATAAASATPLVSAAADRGKSLVGSVRKEAPVALPPARKKRGWLTTLAIVGAAAAATYVVVRKLVGDKGSQWQTARPTTPYAPPVSAEAGVAEPQPDASVPGTGPTDVVASTTSLYGTVGSDAPAAGASTEQRDEVEAAEEQVVEEPEDAVLAEEDTARGGGPDAHPERYDMPGAYVGVEPPEGFTIKGNERSMKYHLPESNAYNRTIAEVWFSSEEAAQEAGFSRAQH